MSYRLRLDGKTVECDTAIEAMDLLRLVRETGAQADYAIAVNPPPMPIHPISPRPQRTRVSNTVTDFLAALKEAFPAPVTNAQMAARLGTTPKGLPAVVLGVRVLLRKWNVPFEEVIERKKRFEGQVEIRQYRLTSKGLKVLQEQDGEKSDQLPLADLTSRRMITLD